MRRSQGHVFAHALNLCEVYYDFSRANGDETAEAAVSDLLGMGVAERGDMEPHFWRAMARLKANHKISLADCAALVLANELGAELLTADRHELEPLSTLSIYQVTFIR